MLFRIITCSLALVATSGATQSYQSNKYPAAVPPSLCPHYPYCDNTVLAGFAQETTGLHQASIPGYPAYLSPHACPNYPFCSHHIPDEAINYRRHNVPAYHQYSDASVHQPTFIVPHQSLNFESRETPAKYPAGLDPASCPNYPYCH